MSVQLENGYTPIANAILDQLVKFSLNGTQVRIILVVWRYTYGFSRKEHSFSENFISNATGLDRRNIRRELTELIKMQILQVVQEATFTKPRTIMFNKNFEEWERASVPTGGEKEGEGEKAPSPEGENAPSPRGRIDPPRNQTKKANSKTIDIDDFFDKLWTLYPRKEGKGSVSKAQKEKLIKIGLEEMTRCVERYKLKIQAEGIQRKFIKQGSTFFNTGYVDFLDRNYEAEEKTQLPPESRKKSTSVNLSDLVEYPEGSGEYIPRWEVPTND